MKRPFLFARVDLIRETHAITADGIKRGLSDKAIEALVDDAFQNKGTFDEEVEDFRGDLAGLMAAITATEKQLSPDGVELLRTSIDNAAKEVIEQNSEPQKNRLAELNRRKSLLDAECLDKAERERRQDVKLAEMDDRVAEAKRQMDEATAALPADEQLKRIEAQKARVDMESEQAMLDELRAYTQPAGGR